MCGIVGYIGTKEASGILLEGLRKLEYRGYDSAGIATVLEGEIHCVRAKGKLHNLEEKLVGETNPARLGIAHTRWATHGKPEEYNAHPHMDMAKRIAVIQNGIIENYRELREELKSRGCEFRSDTDTEVIPHLIAEELSKAEQVAEEPLMEAVRQVVRKLQGAFAIAVICADYPDELIVARQQAPVVLGFGEGEFYCASDTPALIPYTRAILNLENGELARMTPLGVEIYSFGGQRLKKAPRTLDVNPVMVEKQGFKHYMLKEIYEQPGVVRSCLEAYVNSAWTAADHKNSPIRFDLPQSWYRNLQHVQIVACGTSWHAGLVGKYLLEQLADVPTTIHYASEFRYAPAPLVPHTLTIGVTQSGETADTLAALEMEKSRRDNKSEEFEARLLGITSTLR